MKKYNIAIIGATGNVGHETLNILAERKFPVDKLYAIASSDSLGKEVSFGEQVLKISNIENLNLKEVDIAFFSAGSDISKRYIPEAVNSGCIVIDKSSFFRLDSNVPLIVPEANLQELNSYVLRKKSLLSATTGNNQGYIVANPNCCTIPLVVVLKPLDNAATIKRIIISTYQSTSGAGRAGMDELYKQTKAKYVFEDLPPMVFPKQIAFNIFPQIGGFNEDGTTAEESKIALELEKIIGLHVKASVTCVRVPVFVGHCMSVNIEFEKTIDAEEAREILGEADGITILSHLNEKKYATPIDVIGEDFVYVSRIRDDKSLPNSINLWIAADNLRKGAALNAVQIAEELIKHHV